MVHLQIGTLTEAKSKFASDVRPQNTLVTVKMHLKQNVNCISCSKQWIDGMYLLVLDSGFSYLRAVLSSNVADTSKIDNLQRSGYTTISNDDFKKVERV